MIQLSVPPHVHEPAIVGSHLRDRAHATHDALLLIQAAGQFADAAERAAGVPSALARFFYLVSSIRCVLEAGRSFTSEMREDLESACRAAEEEAPDDVVLQEQIDLLAQVQPMRGGKEPWLS